VCANIRFQSAHDEPRTHDAGTVCNSISRCINVSVHKHGSILLPSLKNVNPDKSDKNVGDINNKHFLIDIVRASFSMVINKVIQCKKLIK
jgi:hypothetical protein